MNAVVYVDARSPWHCIDLNEGKAATCKVGRWLKV